MIGRGKAITVLFLLCLLCAPQQSSAGGEAIPKKAYLDTSQEIPILYLSGTPFEMGYQQGRLLADEKGISVAQIGAKTVDKTLRGIPMPFLLRRVLEEASDLEEAIKR